MKPILISFNLCPFVQRSVITLLYKGVEFDIKYIDLANKPDWFLKLSPLGKVPALQIGESVLFESAVINEYLDETNPPGMHPGNPLEKAKHKAWIEFISALLADQYRYNISRSKDEANKHLDSIKDKLQQLDQQVQGPFFADNQFRLVDAAAAPFFMRQKLLDEYTNSDSSGGLDKTIIWAQSLLALPAVQKSVLPEFSDLFKQYAQKSGFYALQ